MRSRFLTALVILALGGLTLALAQQAELKRLEGRYKVVQMEKASGPAPKQVIDNLSFIFKGNKLTLKLAEEEKNAQIQLDPDKDPPAIDISPLDGDYKGKTFPGIYKIDKEELILVMTEKGERPKEFKPEGDAILIRLRREK
jgi:uncharacterized protein (TIGR03067 family)